MDPRNPKNLTQFCGAVERSRKKLATFRKHRFEALRQYVGNHYSDDGTAEPVPINFIEMGVSIYCANLSGGDPKLRVSTPIRSLKSSAFDLQLDVNHVLKEVEFKQTLQEVVREAIFGPAVVKIGVTASENGGELDPGEVYVDVIDSDDWVQDMTTRKYQQAAYAGHKMPMLRSDLEADPDVDQEVLRTVTNADRSPYNDNENRVESIGAGSEFTEEDYSDEQLWVWHLWLRRERLVVMVPCDNDGKPMPKLLKVSPWKGPRRGPFESVCFNPVPGNAMPLPPVAVLRDLHDIINVIYNKLGRQAARQKNVTVVKDDLLRDGQRQIDAGDGDAVRGDPSALKEVNMGGADERGMAFGMHAIDRANVAGGNLESLGGTGPSADTLGQERIIKASASQRINSMQGVVADFVTAVQRHIAYYEFTNPLLSRQLVKRVPGTKVEIAFHMTSARLAGEFLDYNFEMAAYSNKARTPAEQLEAIAGVLDRFVAPYQEQMASQEIAIDFNGLFHTVADLAGVPEIDDILQFGVPSPMPTQQIRGQDPRGPSQPAMVPQQPRRPDTNRMIQDLMTRPNAQQLVGA